MAKLHSDEERAAAAKQLSIDPVSRVNQSLNVFGDENMFLL